MFVTVLVLASILSAVKDTLDAFVHEFQLQTTEAAMLALSLPLSRQAQLIVKGEVLGKVESITTEFYNNSVSIE